MKRKQTGFEIVEIYEGFGQIPSFLLLKRVYEGHANPNPQRGRPDRQTSKIFIYKDLSVGAQDSRLIIVVVITGTRVKIYAAAVEALKKKERQDETQFITKIGGQTSLDPSYFVL